MQMLEDIGASPKHSMLAETIEINIPWSQRAANAVGDITTLEHEKAGAWPALHLVHGPL